MKNPDAIAIDGPAASGKSTLGERLAEHLNYLYLDTGIMYRAVTLAALREFHSVKNEADVTRLAEEIQIDIQSPSHPNGRKFDVLLNGEDVTEAIRRVEVEKNVSKVSAYRGVRIAMTEQQRRIGHRGKIVMVGRDIGTVVLPDAPLKIYLEASAEVRAQRRYDEKVAKGDQISYEEVYQAILQRDETDAKRDVAPMCAAKDARIINTDLLSIEQVYQEVIELLEG